MTRTEPIASDIYRMATWSARVGIAFNHLLIAGEHPGCPLWCWPSTS